MRSRVLCFLALAATGCPGAATTLARETKPAPVARNVKHELDAALRFAALEAEVLDLMAAADPRVAQRMGVSPPEKVLQRIGTAAILAEDVEARVHGGSLDLFAFRGRIRVLDEARAKLDAWREPLPGVSPDGAAITRPVLERELLVRAIAAERARAELEQRLGDESSDLVRGIVDTWAPPASPAERDLWLASHLSKLRASFASPAAAVGPNDLEDALYPLERMLTPSLYPKSVAAMTELRLSLSGDGRVHPALYGAAEIEGRVGAFVGIATDAAALRRALTGAAATLRDEIDAHRGSMSADELDHAAQALLFVTGRCGEKTAASPMRSMVPPPERLAVCGALSAIVEGARTGRAAPALMAIHDAVVAGTWALGERAEAATLVTKLDADRVEQLRRFAVGRPAAALAVGVAALVLLQDRTAGEHRMEARAAQWLAFGDAPLDIVEREVFSERSSPVAPRP